jgi:hypothetical protein
MKEMDFGSLQFDVVTSEVGHGHTPEQIAEMALAKIIYVAQDANPLIREQAEAYKNHIRHVLVQYMKKAIKSNHTTIANKLREAGHSDLIKILEI